VRESDSHVQILFPPATLSLSFAFSRFLSLSCHVADSSSGVGEGMGIRTVASIILVSLTAIPVSSASFWSQGYYFTLSPFSIAPYLWLLTLSLNLDNPSSFCDFPILPLLFQIFTCSTNG
jgi:hypothetical protein